MSAIVSNLFINQSIVFESKNLDVSLVPLPETSQTESKFGLLSLKAITTPLTELEQDFVFQVDCSGSMSDICSDGRTKMQHILHTLRNMILYFKENPSLKVNITIHAFDDTIYKIVERTLVNESTYDKIITEINTIVPRSCTNIEQALNDTKEIITQLVAQYPNTTKSHIFMTDGQATAGNIRYSDLRNLIDNTITNIFIGFGLDHDSKLLNAISKDKNSNYYFIDKLENAGLVYGEILHGIVYKFLKNVEISITDGLIYDYKTNTWNNTLKIGEIVSESSKFYHLISNNTCRVQITGKRVDDGSDILVNIPIQEESVDLTKYIYRQRTQQILFKINNFNKNKNSVEDEQNNLKTEMKEIFDELKKYISDNNLTNDILLKNLCDDIYICYRTFGTSLGDMFCCARENSQGQQRAYTATNIPNSQDFDQGFDQGPVSCIRRQNAMNFRSINNNFEYDDPNDIQHQLSDSTCTPYRSQTMSHVMRSVTSGVRSHNLEESEDTQVV